MPRWSDIVVATILGGLSRAPRYKGMVQTSVGLRDIFGLKLCHPLVIDGVCSEIRCSATTGVAIFHREAQAQMCPSNEVSAVQCFLKRTCW
jgi:hypothetical protein